MSCIACPYASVHVPPSVAWRLPDDPAFLWHLEASAPNDYRHRFRYWADVNAAAAATNSSGALLHALCGSDELGDVRRSLLRALPPAGGSARRGRRSGLFIVLHGDSFMRITFVRLLQALASDDPPLLRVAEFRISEHARSDSLICCPPSSLAPTSDGPAPRPPIWANTCEKWSNALLDLGPSQ